ncbi:DNA-3-methyladenine glycosylase 2 [Paenibacillus sp. 481]|uniref:DNA-3-methyladenine glycosylase 2 n=1 Tax=Paenibacillus sp. 481 TaxID=2835869 RepID=UPI001E3CFBDF|nr:DNA-3-methyladenine glycosylase 2 [Paenibacillus sp. 481]UHA72179.1 DNA-3-methyladenine glycosylase 2 [Paenibacillus sp. 481]
MEACLGSTSNSNKGTIVIDVPPYFDFEHCLTHLKRGDNDVLVTVHGHRVSKALDVNGVPMILELSSEASHGVEGNNQREPQPQSQLHATVYGLSHHRLASVDWEAAVRTEIDEWFDLQRDLRPFYAFAERDPILAPLAKRYSGLRIIGSSSLYHSLCWAIMGQQITMSFAATLKRRFVQQFGEYIEHDGERFYLFPRPEVVAKLTPEQVMPLQFSRKKAEYLIEVAVQIASGRLSKKQLIALNSFSDAVKQLTAIRGIGAWTANSVLMHCLRNPRAFPLADVGLHNAIKRLLKLEHKPSLAEMEQYGTRWAGWEAYATFYLWRSLDDEWG